MDKVVSMFVWFVCVLITAIEAVNHSWEHQPYSHNHLEENFGLYKDHYGDSGNYVMNGRNMLEEAHQYASSMEQHDKRDLEALLSFKKAITSDPFRSLSNWTTDNSENVCLWNGIWCRRRTKRVVAIILSGF